jgi:hypothetical protein
MRPDVLARILAKRPLDRAMKSFTSRGLLAEPPASRGARVPVHIDGEVWGSLPMSFRIEPAAVGSSGRGGAGGLLNGQGQLYDGRVMAGIIPYGLSSRRAYRLARAACSGGSATSRRPTTSTPTPEITGCVPELPYSPKSRCVLRSPSPQATPSKPLETAKITH